MTEDKAKKRKIVVFEDDPTFRSSYVSALETRGFEVKVIPNPGEFSIDDLVSFQPTLVSLDIHMPRKDGLEVLAELRAHESLKEIPAVFVTSQGETGKERALELGAVGYFTKFETPITEIVQKIDNLI